MRFVAEGPRPIREIATQWIPMPDGCRLAARIWLPVDAEQDPVPALLEYLPYRRRDGTVSRDAVTQPYMARHGYAAVRVDIRGTGDSEGVMRDEYDAPEMRDGVEVIAWLARQPWCNGRVGMWGISWGGINALQIAALSPPALKAIMPIGFADDRYDGDCHFMGGCMLEGNISWGNTFMAGCSRPPDPAVVGDAWREQWLSRLQAIEPPVALWLGHPRRDEYWRSGSARDGMSRITAAVYAVSGWQDSYSRNVLPLLESLKGPRKGLIGPWAHSWPHLAKPGPAIGFLLHAVRWWDHWLKDIDTGIMDEPMLRVWMGDWTPPRKWLDEAPGRWVDLPVWPPGQATADRLFLVPSGLAESAAGADAVATVSSVETLGSKAGYQCSYGLGPDLSDDQQADDALSLCFDGETLQAAIEMLGEPVLDLVVASDEPDALLAVRLCDVAPDGTSLRLSYGLLDLSHRDGDDAPSPMVPGAWTRIRIRLCALAHRMAPGHRIRLALSTSYWPIAWPSPKRATLSLRLADSVLTLPRRPEGTPDRLAAGFEPPEGAPADGVRPLRSRPSDRPQDRITTDPATGEVIIVRDRDRGAWHVTDADIDYDTQGLLQFAIRPGEPLSARQEFGLTTTLGRDGWRIRTQASTTIRCDAAQYHVVASLSAFLDEEPVFSRSWTVALPRRDPGTPGAPEA